MTSELFWLALTLLMTALFWVPYVLDRIAVRGLMPALSDTKPESGGPHSLWAQRSIKAHRNAIENLVIFAAAVLALNALGLSTAATQGAVTVYFFARLVHFVVYSAGIPFLRTISFALAWGAQIVLLLTLLGWM